MRRQDLEQMIHELIRTEYNATYIGRLEVEQTDSEYRLTIGLPSYMAPTTMAINCETDKEFIDFITSELKTRNYMRLDIYKVTRTPHSREE